MRALLLASTVAALALPVQAADRVSGNGALALGALVGLQSPMVSPGNKVILRKLLGGDVSGSLGGSIMVKADSVTCRASDVDIAAHSCLLSFGSVSRTVTGRAAHEIFATLIENGVAGDGAAGSIFEAVSYLSCTVSPRIVQQKGGGGADCSYDAGPGS